MDHRFESEAPHWRPRALPRFTRLSTLNFFHWAIFAVFMVRKGLTGADGGHFGAGDEPVGWVERSDTHHARVKLYLGDGQGDGFRKCSTHPTRLWEL
jgi:hypothetical protein